MMSNRIGTMSGALAGALFVLLLACCLQEAFSDESCPPCSGEQLELFDEFDKLELEKVEPKLESYRDTDPKIGNMRASEILKYQNTLCDLKTVSLKIVAPCCAVESDSSSIVSYERPINSYEAHISADGTRLNRGIKKFINAQVSKLKESCMKEVGRLLKEALSRLQAQDKELLGRIKVEGSLDKVHIESVVGKIYAESLQEQLHTACSQLTESFDELGLFKGTELLLGLQGSSGIGEWWNVKIICNNFLHNYRSEPK